ncbi:VOC family protein [Dongia sp.]|uniref:VOC family protein n=1 Tax=Dongia sp. TaxID=1977262 RepID=UPI0035AE4E24
MKPRISVLTLAVGDLERALRFYRDGLGLATDGIVGTEFPHGAVAFFRLNDHLMLALYPTDSLAQEAQIDPGDMATGAVAVGHNVASKDEVDAVMAEAEAAGARITDPARTRFWGGYGGHFRDPDGHLWEVAWNPAFDLAD